MEKDIINTLSVPGERVTSLYAEIYLDDDFCAYEKPVDKQKFNLQPKDDRERTADEWISPSDLLIGIIDLKPPFTSKITRGKTHEGIIAIGNEIIEKERARFLKRLNELIKENNGAWNNILEQEKERVIKRIKRIYEEVFKTKSKVMQEEIDEFYEASLKKLEHHIKSDVDRVLISVHAGIVNTLNTEIMEKLKKEKIVLENTLNNRYASEIHKIKKYYKLLQENEKRRYQSLIDHAIVERNDALKAFYKQIQQENITSTMYVMGMERKKCRVKQFFLEKFQSDEISQKIEKIKEKQEIIDTFREKDVLVSEINNKWEEKIQKVLQLFLKFISFSLKLLPEQTTFLLDLEKMVVLQLNEIQKMPEKAYSLLIEKQSRENIFKFNESKMDEKVCREEPFVIEGELSDLPGPQYGSRETLPLDVDLPYVRLGRRFIYAQCQRIDEVRELLEAQRCKCQDIPNRPTSPVAASPSSTMTESEHDATTESESSIESMVISAINRLHKCPVRNCHDWAKRYTFPHLDSYLDYTEENYSRVTTIIDETSLKDCSRELIDAKELARAELPFGVTKELYHNVETQYSSQEDLNLPIPICPCTDSGTIKNQKEFFHGIKETSSKTINDAVVRRKHSIMALIREYPKVLNFFTDTNFNHKL